jgi:acyl transferase domain-containing protein/surfactin synthase thioesterase subunit/acyl carrier protein
LKAGINSFGWGGTNAHVIIEQYKNNHNTLRSDYKKNMWCLPLSAKTPEALKAYVEEYQARITDTTANEWKDICLSSSLRKPHFTHRALFSANTKEMLLEALEYFNDNTAEHTTSPSGLIVNDKVVMVFPGQGAQWLGMGKDLIEKEPIFRECIEQTDQMLRQFCDWSLLDQLNASPEQTRLHEIDVIQPTLFAIQFALAKLWISWGIRPHAVVGHSMGEIAAACIAGTIDLYDAARIICARSKLMRTLSGRGGAMVVTELSFRDAESLLVRYPTCSIAVSNSPKSTVLAGDQKSILKLITELESAGLFCRQVKVDVASHSSQMDPILSELHEALTLVNPRPGVIPFYSTAINSMLPGTELNADYWVKNLRNPVHFSDTIRKLIHTDHRIFIEISPHPLLCSAMQECAAHANKKVLVVNSLQREKPGQETLYSQLGELFTQGFDINWKTFYQTEKAPAISLPNYPFQRERYEPEIRAHKVNERNKNQDYPLAGNLLTLADQNDLFFWETEISIHSLPLLKDHRVNNEVIVPGAALIEMVFEGAREIYKDSLPSIGNLKFVNTISLTLEETATVQLKIRRELNPVTFSIYRKTSDPFNKTRWELLAQGELKTNKTLPSAREIDFSGDKVLYSKNEYYTYLKSLGLDYGLYFKGITEIKENGRADQIVFRLQSNDLINKCSVKYTIHPALLDACLQPLFCGHSGEKPAAGLYTSFLSGIDELSLLESVKPFQELQGVATLYPCVKAEERTLSQVRADISIFTPSGKPLMVIKGLTGKVINTGASKKTNDALDNWRFKISWEKLSNIPTAHEDKEPGSGTWLVFGDPYGISNQFIKKMEAKKFRWVHVTPGNCFAKIDENHYTIAFGNKKDYESVLNACPSFRGIIHLSSLNYAWKGSGVTAEQIENHQVFGSLSFVFLYQQLAERKCSPMPAITIVTNGVQAITELDIAQPMHRPLWGLAKVMWNERPELPLACFDLDADPTADQIDAVVHHLTYPDHSENEIALRTDRYVPRLRRASEEVALTAFPQEFRHDVTYLITGYKGIAFDFIEWMISKGARHFALLSRSEKITPPLESRILVLQKKGCHLQVFPVDVGNYPALEKTIKRVEKYMAPIGGVVHAAGVIKANAIADITASEFLHTLSPKMKGAWNLHLLTRKKALHCFILFSSASTLIGLSGQGSYVAANAFLDGLAYMRRRSGLPGLSVNWGVISDSGMVADDRELERYAREEGFKPLKMKQAIDVFERIHRHDYAQISVVDINLTRMATYYPPLAKSNYFKDLLRPMEISSPANGKSSYSWNDLTTADEITTALTDFLIKEVSQITRLSPARIKPMMTFKELGLDSIMAIQLRNRLGETFALNLSVAMFWNHPSISEYAAFIHHLTGNQTSGKFKSPALALNSKWLAISKADPSAMFRIFCFHDAGGDSTLFRGWEDLMGDTFEVVAIELPGRGENSQEEMPLSSEDLIAQIKDELRPYLDKPYLFFGHSMGGLLAFETAKALRHEGLQQPELMVLSSVPALNTYVKQDIEFKNISAEIPTLQTMDASIRKSVLTLLKNDLRMINSYRYVAGKPLNLDLLAIRGSEDPRITDQQVKQWKEETTGSFKVITRPGGHRYITEDSYFLTSLIFSEWHLMRRQRDVPASENLILST